MVKVNLTDEDLAPRGENNYFNEGVHEVLIDSAKRGKTDAGKEYVEFIVKGENGESDTARLWFTTEKSCKYALSILAGIASHNKESEADKQKVRDAFKQITDTDQVDDKFLAKFENDHAFFTVYKSDRTYEKDGETKHSYDKNIYGYSPKPKTDLVANAMKQDTSNIDLSEIPFN
jgi:hypothetical protein